MKEFNLIDEIAEKIVELKEENKVLKKALELAIETMNYEICADAIINLYKLAMKNISEHFEKVCEE